MNSGPRSNGFRSVLELVLLSGGRGRLFFVGLHGFRRQPQLEEVPRRHRVLSAHDHHLPERILEHAGRRPAGCGRAGDQGAQQPARAVDADEAGREHAGGGLPGLSGHLSRDLHAEGSRRLLAPAAGRLDLGGDLRPQVVPQFSPARRGEGLDLHLAPAVPDGHPGAVLLGHRQLDLAVRADRHMQAAEILAFPHRIRLVGIPRPALGPRYARRNPGLRRLVVERLILVDLVVFL